MADEAFALSPISARATQPGEADYEAIREAFMETSRGRWFLGEYAKRNRNADTSMVLDAVARIEETLAAQRQAAPPPDDGRKEALEALRGAVVQATEAVTAALDSLALSESLAPVSRGTRIIKEISWRWREIGADSRICDLIDSQVGAIDASCEQIAGADPRAAITEALSILRARLEALDNPETASGAAAAEPPSAASSFAQPEDIHLHGTPAPEPAETATFASETGAALPVETAGEFQQDATADPVEDPDAIDEAVLDMIALEMAAPDPLGDDIYTDDVAAAQDEPPAMAAAVAAPVPPAATPVVAATPVEPRTVAATSPAPAEPEPAPRSLGSAILANGFLDQHRNAANDPLAPIRRMSQVEKIAFFS